MSNRWDLIRVSLARRFFLASLLQAVIVLSLALGMAAAFGRQTPAEKLRLHWAFLISTGFLAIGSWYLERAHAFVRRERQPEFRRSLLTALAFAMLFVSVQGFGLWALDKGVRDPYQAQVGVHGFVVMLTALHGMHFIIAQSVLLWVVLSAFADRYDHEYFWGVTFAAWCWHVLGIVWLGILFIFTMAFVA
jgi:heme/copper-type cytochrome/quinol oxidase subunit 3